MLGRDLPTTDGNMLQTVNEIYDISLIITREQQC
jgi:hypothetical protein